MVDKLEKIKTKLLTIDEVILEGIKEAFIDNDTIIEDMNIAQLESGLRGDGTQMPDYSPTSVEVYGKPEGPIRLKDTGAFHRGIQLNTGNEDAELTGTDSKTSELEFEYGSEIIQLTEENRTKFKNDYIRPSIEDRIKREIE